MNKKEFLEWKKENSPVNYFIEDIIVEWLSDKMLDAPLDATHSLNYFWKEIASFCLDQIE